MGKVIVFGHAPLPYEDTEKSYAPGIRTWQFAAPLMDDGHEVVVLASRIPFVYPDDMDDIVRSEEHGCVVYRVSQQEFEVGGSTDRLMEDFDPDCVVAAGAYCSYVASMYAGLRPFWADANGSLIAEAQAKMAVYWDDNYLEHFLRMNNGFVHSADRFSTVSERQKYELIGHLGMEKRLIAETFGFEFAYSIPAAVQQIDFPEPADPTGGEMKPDDFIVLWSGGFNTWTDVETLFRGMELAMERSPKVRFVSTGGSIHGHDEKTYPKFEALVAGSDHKDRFHLKGWVKKSEAMSYYGTASVGINIDAENYEALLGFRNRILEWALAELPTISTNLCELTNDLESRGLLFAIPVGDPEALAEQVLELEGDRDRLRGVGAKVKRYVLENYSFDATTGPLRKWVKNPEHSPDFERLQEFRLNRLKDVRAVFTPPITPDSPALEKLKFYLLNEGPLTAVRKAFSSLFRKPSGKTEEEPEQSE